MKRKRKELFEVLSETSSLFFRLVLLFVLLPELVSEFHFVGFVAVAEREASVEILSEEWLVFVALDVVQDGSVDGLLGVQSLL